VDRQHIWGQRGIRLKSAEIDEAPGPYAMSFGFDLRPLCESIRNIGLLNPPCIGMGEKGEIEVITGYRRLLALKKLGWPEVTCEDLSFVLPSPRERLLFAFYENLASRVFNPVEKALILRRLEPLLDKEDILKRMMPLLSLPAHEGTFRFYAKLAEMNHAFKDAVAGGRISLNTAKSLMDLEPESAESAFQGIINLTLNFNQQTQFIDIMKDLFVIEGKFYSQILEAEPMAAILENKHLNKPQKAKKLLEELRSRRYPRWKAAERRFQENIARLSLPEGARIDHPAYFEAPGYRLEVQFQDGVDLMEKLRRLSQVSGLEEFRDPLDEHD
jgi:hypothetical protein